MPINSRTKGATGEREFCKWIKENLELDFLPERNLDQVRSGGSDILGVYPFVFEVKRVEKLNKLAAWIQVNHDARKAGGEPVVAFRKNRQPWRFMISATLIGCTRGHMIINEREFIEWAKKKLGGIGMYEGEVR